MGNKAKTVGQDAQMKPVNGWWIVCVSAVAFAAVAAYMLVGLNSDYLYAVQEHSIFVADRSFYDMMMVKPGSLLSWLGCYFTQFFYHPALGAGLLVAMWVAIYAVSVKAFGLKGWWSSLALQPVGALLCSVIFLGYWLYYIKIQGYWFAETLGLLVTVTALWLNRLTRTGNNWVELGKIVLWSVVGYVATGWFGLLAVLLMALTGVRKGVKARIVPLLTAAACIVVVPIVCYQFCTQMRIEDAWMVGFPMFQIEKYVSWSMELPFIVILVALIAMAVMSDGGKDLLQTRKELILTSAAHGFCMGLVVFFAWLSHYDNYNYHAELRMSRAVDEQRWQDALNVMADNPGDPTREMILLKNVSLTNLGTIGDKMFRYSNYSTAPVSRDSLPVRMAQTVGPQLYYNYGRLNFATRWCIENGTEHGFSVENYKTLTRCALISGEFELAEKYIKILKKTTFHREWAEQYEPMLKDHALVQTWPEFQNIIEYHNNFTSMLDGDEGLVEMYLMNYFGNTMNRDSKLLQETTLVYSLMLKDIQKFWPRFFLYAHMHSGEDMPIHYQEAAYLYGHLENEVDISRLPFDQVRIVQRYQNFQQLSNSYLQRGMSSEQVGEAMKPMFGDTFWWFYFFCRGRQSY